MRKQAKMIKGKWGKEQNSSDLKPKRHKRVYKKMKAAYRQNGKWIILKELQDGTK